MIGIQMIAEIPLPSFRCGRLTGPVSMRTPGARKYLVPLDKDRPSA